MTKKGTKGSKDSTTLEQKAKRAEVDAELINMVRAGKKYGEMVKAAVASGYAISTAKQKVSSARAVVAAERAAPAGPVVRLPPKSRSSAIMKREKNVLKEQIRAMIRAGEPEKDMVKLVTDAGYADGTAYNWIRDCKQTIRDSAAIAEGEDFDRKRFDKVRDWDVRAQKYRDKADVETEWKPIKAYEGLAIEYDRFIGQALHFFTIPPDRDMNQDEVQLLVMRSLLRHVHKFPRQQQQRLHDHLGELLLERPQRTGRPPKVIEGDLDIDGDADANLVM